MEDTGDIRFSNNWVDNLIEVEDSSYVYNGTIFDMTSITGPDPQFVDVDKFDFSLDELSACRGNYISYCFVYFTFYSILSINILSIRRCSWMIV